MRPDRELTTHHTGAEQEVRVGRMSDPGAGGAPRHYRIAVAGNEARPGAVVNLHFADSGNDGVTNESLLAVIIDRLECFQQGPLPCPENSEALTRLREAMGSLHRRTHLRRARGVEGQPVQ